MLLYLGTDGLLRPIPPAAAGLGGLAALPLGAILIASVDGHELDALAAIMGVWMTSPWCPVVLAVPTPPAPVSLQLLQSAGLRLSALSRAPGDPPPPVERIAELIARRPAPTVADVADYVGIRCGRATASLVLASARTPAGAAAARVRRHARRLGALRPRHWQSLTALLQCLAAGWREAASLERVAFAHEVAPRSLSAWTQRYLQLAWRDALALRAWEPALERALRVSGYVMWSGTAVASDGPPIRAVPQRSA